MEGGKIETIDEYLASFPRSTKLILAQIRGIIQLTAPKAKEVISYGIPAFRENDSYLAYFAGYKKHVSLYPAPKGEDTLNRQMAPYRSGKGTLQFSLEKQLPAGLIKKVVKSLRKANKARAAKSKTAARRKVR